MDEMNQLKVFTAEEANRMLPKLTDMVTTLQAHHREILAKEVEIDALELVADKKGSTAVNGKVEEYTRLVNRFYNLIDEIQETGCLLKDLDLGLVDFYSLQNNHLVFLCWKLGEPAIEFWHDTGAGYSSRQPIQK